MEGLKKEDHDRSSESCTKLSLYEIIALDKKAVPGIWKKYRGRMQVVLFAKILVRYLWNKLDHGITDLRDSSFSLGSYYDSFSLIVDPRFFL